METRRLKGERTVPLVDDVLDLLPHLTEKELRRVAEAISKALTHNSNEGAHDPLWRTHAVVCDHGVTFDAKAARGLSVVEIRRRWPRGFGPCPKNCGWSGICYASDDHFIAGDW